MAACVSTPTISPRRFKIYFQDDAVCKRSQEAVSQLIATAMTDDSTASTTTTSNAALLAKKALKYRKVYERMATAGVDVTAPEFDASSVMGVSWCKTTSLKAYCEKQQQQHHF